MNKPVKVKIKEFGKIVTGKTPSSNFPEDFGQEVLFVTPPDFNNQKYIDNTQRSLSMSGKAKLISKLLPSESLLVTCIGDIGRVALNKSQAITNQQINSIIPNLDLYSPDYLYYALVHNRKRLLNKAGQTVVSILNKTEFEKIEIPIFKDRDYQIRVSKILSLLDQKIYINNQLIKELEILAKTVYDYWFVQFEFPNSKGLPYKSNGGKLIFNKILKREIPSEWEVNRIDTVLKTVLGGTPSTSNKSYWDGGGINWLNSGEVDNFPITKTAAKITQKGLDDSNTVLMPKGSVAISITRYIRPTILGIDTCANQSVVGIIESKTFKQAYLYPYLKNEVPRYLAVRTGANQPHINKEIIDSSLIIKPSEHTLEKYYKICDPLYAQIINKAFEIDELETLRDWLVPMLMNGRVVPLAEKIRV